MKIKHFWTITKPGIIFGNLITVIGGFFLGSRGQVDIGLFIATMAGTSFVIASGCVFNNFIDRDIDKLMQRTKNRVLVKGLLSPYIALAYATILGFSGLVLLYLKTNLLALSIACIGLFVYVVIYSLWQKRNSTYATLIGSISGAVPILVGYCAATNMFDLGAILLFLILSLWQMPHSYAIAIYRLTDYQQASIPVLPIKKGIYQTKIHMLAFTVMFVIATLMLTLFGYTGFAYLFMAGISGIGWIWLCILGFKTQDDQIWARRMFIASIINIVLLCILMSLDVK
jgi:heme o synthase